MKFRSGTDEDLPIGLTTGHTCVVTAEGNVIDKRFYKEALAQGCLPDGVEPDKEEAPAFDRDEVIGTAIEEMITDGNEGDFLGDGRPDLRKLSARVGFKVERDEADRLFAEVSKG